MTLTTWLKHFLNPLHVYCRLVDLGCSKQWAKFVAKLYEQRVFSKYIIKRKGDKPC